ncbi:hypothetical protein [Hespellia stercorisuis]|uniref:Uncharacterized protein n=1 Tax=Hespellia stercorisuis DSM 15480 TaxID=1121950 RepID=A0A1M6REU8_9FIRM|nr:hypothetical protein [Hespellia stercorisuis]SHK31005.1 hypothetical protein SAMN02745243_02673 [Hespellia stercorisuis DSM 15480]
MNIQSISKKDKEIVTILDAEELVLIGNVMYQATKHQDSGDIRLTEQFYRLYSDIMIARNLCKYGHLDNFSFEHIEQARKKAREKAD